LYPTLFYLWKLPIRAYGVMLVIGFLIAVWRAQRISKRYGFTPESTMDAALVCLICGLIGARIGFILANWSSFSGNLSEIFRIWSGGLSFHGGLAAGLLGGLIYARVKKLPIWNGMDMFAPSIVFAYAFGRIGCFLNGCCYGSPTTLPWGVKFPDEQFPGMLTRPSHPAQLYSTLINLVLFVLLIRLEKRRKFRGQIFAAFLMLHGIYRFGVELIRAGATSRYAFGWVTDGHIAALIVFLVGLTIYWLQSRKGRIEDEPELVKS
jgi:phosphatidylglycerol:prolipoprotein diacylglycerol transferase